MRVLSEKLMKTVVRKHGNGFGKDFENGREKHICSLRACSNNKLDFGKYR